MSFRTYKSQLNPVPPHTQRLNVLGAIGMGTYTPEYADMLESAQLGSDLAQAWLVSAWLRLN